MQSKALLESKHPVAQSFDIVVAKTVCVWGFPTTATHGPVKLLRTTITPAHQGLPLVKVTPTLSRPFLRKSGKFIYENRCAGGALNDGVNGFWIGRDLVKKDGTPRLSNSTLNYFYSLYVFITPVMAIDGPLKGRQALLCRIAAPMITSK